MSCVGMACQALNAGPLFFKSQIETGGSLYIAASYLIWTHGPNGILLSRPAPVQWKPRPLQNRSRLGTTCVTLQKVNGNLWVPVYSMWGCCTSMRLCTTICADKQLQAHVACSFHHESPDFEYRSYMGFTWFLK